MDLNEFVNIVQVLGIFAVIFGIWLALKQLKLLRNQRRDLAIMECARAFEDKEFTEAYRLLTCLKVGQTKEQLLNRGEKYEIAALRATMKFETIGLLVYKGVVPIDAIEDLVGGAALVIWKVLVPWIEDTRIDRSHASFLEWYQWLVDRLIERGEPDRPPAFQTYKNWKPPST
ncbi:DUF4760 domain-containing protein [Salinimicrobium gaetbulicola]|uniref:DUF4760 domain-containing protein n=1 Tax=Salinimicrobium gaetbulicola TaxID=999702 RepID=A0ABW3IFD6_9FLAO